MAYGYPTYNAYNPYSPMQLYQTPMMQQPQQITQPQMQPVQQTTQPAQGLSSASRPVTNREEAVSTPADFSGALMVFPDLPNNRVYLKRWNMQTGSADFGEFAPVIPEQPRENETKQATAFASLEEFHGLQETVANLQEEINRLKKPTGKTVKKNDASDE